MKKKTSVNEVQLGMYVAELDRPWRELPFEPPFEVQGFVISSDQNIEQLKKYCKYVFIDEPEPRPASSTRGKSAVINTLEVEDPLQKRYLISEFKHKGGDKPTITAASTVKTDGGKERYYVEHKNSTRSITKPRGEKWWDTDRRAEKRIRKTRAKRRTRDSSLRIVHEFEGRTDESQHRGQTGILFINSEEKTPVYPVQQSFEQEIVVAHDIMNDTLKVCDGLVHDIKAGRTPNTTAVKQTVKGLVQSVIRNPDALTWLTKLKQQDNYTYYHSMAACVMALTLGRHLGFPESDLNYMGVGTLLQDIGKVKIPKELLDKKEKLTSPERQILRKHVELGIKMLNHQRDFSTEALEIVRSHHERHDGSGYPQGIHGDLITPATTIAAMADTFQALTSHRPYRPAMTSLEALTKMYELGGEWFPQAMVEHLIQCVGPFPIGTFVMLNTRDVAVVISPNRIQQLKPTVMVVLDATGNRLEPPESIDLSRQTICDDSIPWKIKRVLNPEDYGLDSREFFF